MEIGEVFVPNMDMHGLECFWWMTVNFVSSKPSRSLTCHKARYSMGTIIWSSLTSLAFHIKDRQHLYFFPCRFALLWQTICWRLLTQVMKLCLGIWIDLQINLCQYSTRVFSLLANSQALVEQKYFFLVFSNCFLHTFLRAKAQKLSLKILIAMVSFLPTPRVGLAVVKKWSDCPFDLVVILVFYQEII
jgi:hypothetical protein